jgi:hypothetical protein
MIKPHIRFFTLLAAILFLVPAYLFAQNTNAYQFIEPNISVAYDSNTYKITRRYSNTTYETESYDFEFKTDTLNKTIINIKAEHPVEFAPRKTQDSLIFLGVKEVMNIVSDSFSIVDFDKEVRDVNGFSCIGTVAYNKIRKQYSTFIICWHFSIDDQTWIEFASVGRNDLDADYEILRPVLSGFKAYSEAEIAIEEKLINSKYAVVVTPVKTIIDNFQYRPMTYVGVVKTEQKPEHRIKEVRLTTSLGEEIFSPEPDGKIPILCNDKGKGEIIKKGKLVLLNSFGKNVKIPFTFSYINN